MSGKESGSSDGILFDSTTSKESILSTTQATSGFQQHEGQDTDTARETQAPLNLNHTYSAAFDERKVFSWFAAIPDDSEARDGRVQGLHLDQHNVASSNNVRVKRNFGVDEVKIRDTLAKMHSSLSTSSFGKCGEYRRCPSGTVKEVNETLAWLRNDEEAHHERDRSVPRQRHDINDHQPQGLAEYDYIQGNCSAGSTHLQKSFITHQGHVGFVQTKSKFVHIMKALFQTFLPIDYTSEMVAKYWGAVNFLLQVRQTCKFDGCEHY